MSISTTSIGACSQNLMMKREDLDTQLVLNPGFKEESAEKILNHDFQSLDTNVLDDPTFDSPTGNWTAGTGWLGSMGNMFQSGGTGLLSQVNSTLTAGAYYTVTLEIAINSGGDGTIYVDLGSTGSTLEFTTASGTEVLSGVCAGDGVLSIYGTGASIIITGVQAQPLGGDWTKDSTTSVATTGATIEGLGSIANDKANWSIYQPIPGFALGKSYKVTFTAKRLTGTSALLAGIGFTETFNKYIGTDYTTHTFYQTITNDATDYENVVFGGLQIVGTTTFDIQSVSVKELGSSWTVPTGWSIGEDGVTCEVANSSMTQDITSLITPGAYYKVIFNVKSIWAGRLNVNMGGDTAQLVGSTGIKKLYFDALTTDDLEFYGTGTSPEFTISDISVQRVGAVALKSLPPPPFTNTKSLSFDGSDDIFDTNYVPDTVIQDSFSISLWIKAREGRPTAAQAPFALINASSPSDGLSINLSSTGQIGVFFTSNGDFAIGTTDATLAAGEMSDYIHLVLSVTKHASADTSYALYEDGVEHTMTYLGGTFFQVSAANHALFDSDDNTLRLGAREGDGVSAIQHYDGYLDEFALFDTALSEDAAIEIYNGGDPANLASGGTHFSASNLVTYYRFEDDTTDTAGTSDGTVTGATFDSSVPSS